MAAAKMTVAELEAFLQREFPQAFSGGDIVIESADGQTCLLRQTYSERMLRPGGTVSGPTLMALADRYPEFVAERVIGVAFVGTSAGGMSEVTYGLPLPALGVKAVRRAVPGVLKALVAQTALVERGRRAAADLFAGLVKRYSFGSGHEVDPGVARTLKGVPHPRHLRVGEDH